jgi:hypothetical protein
VTRNLRNCGVVVAALLIVPVAIGCGGGGDGSDEEYVTAFCETQREFTTTLEDAIRNATTTSDFDEIAAPFETLADEFEDMDPPEGHEGLVRRDSRAVVGHRGAGEGGAKFSAVTSLPRDPLTGMPEGPRERLRDVADGEPACEGLNVFQG